MTCVFKVGVDGFRVRISTEGAGLVQGLGDIAVVCTDVLLRSSVFFDQQRQGAQACDSTSVSCFQWEYLAVRIRLESSLVARGWKSSSWP